MKLAYTDKHRHAQWGVPWTDSENDSVRDTLYVSPRAMIQIDDRTLQMGDGCRRLVNNVSSQVDIGVTARKRCFRRPEYLAVELSDVTYPQKTFAVVSVVESLTNSSSRSFKSTSTLLNILLRSRTEDFLQDLNAFSALSTALMASWALTDATFHYPSNFRFEDYSHLRTLLTR